MIPHVFTECPVGTVEYSGDGSRICYYPTWVDQKVLKLLAYPVEYKTELYKNFYRIQLTFPYFAMMFECRSTQR